MSKTKPKPPKWWEVYPQGTKEGDEEQRFFKVLERNPKYKWRSVEAIGKEAKLELPRVEQIINKYYKRGMVFPSPSQDDQWGYWERNPELVNQDISTLAEKDQAGRIDDSLKNLQDTGQGDDSLWGVKKVANPSQKTFWIGISGLLLLSPATP